MYCWALRCVLCSLIFGICLALASPAIAASGAAGTLISRTPVLDGVLEPGEWPVTFSIAEAEGKPAATAGAAWDSSRLYLLVTAPSVARAVVYIDAGGDGWLNGADNYEITLDASSDPVQVTSRLYNSHLDSPARALGPIVANVQAAAKNAGGATVIEAAIPKNADTGLLLTPGRKLSLGYGVSQRGEPDKFVPADARSYMQPVELAVDSVSAPPGVQLSLKSRDRRVVPGQEITADFELRNTTADPIIIEGSVISAEPRMADLVNVLTVRGQVLDKGEKTGNTYKTRLPDTMPLGAFLLKAVVTLEQGVTAVAYSSVDVVEPVDVALDTGAGPASVGGQRAVVVSVTSNSSRTASGTVKLIVPEALAASLERDTRKYAIRKADATERLQFDLKIAPETPAGSYPISAEVTAEGYQRTLTSVLVVR